MKIVQTVRRNGKTFRISIRPVEIGGVKRYQAELEEMVAVRTSALRMALENVKESQRVILSAHLETIHRLASAAEFKDEETADASFAPKAMLLMAVATSIDALAVGITLALLPGVNIVAAVLFIGCITFILSAVGLKVGNVFGLNPEETAALPA